MFVFTTLSFCIIGIVSLFRNEIWNKYYSTKKTIQMINLGDVLQTLKEFALFKIRITSSYYLETGFIKSDGKEYEIVYYNGDIRYKIRFSKNRGVKQIYNVETHLGVNVTSEILELMGPGLNFYGILTTPSILGWKDGLLFKYRNGQEVFYNTNDIIKLSLVNL
jgi:hypothetical protein